MIALLDGYSAACLLGSVSVDGGDGAEERAVYSGDQLVAELMDRDGMDRDEALEFVSFNVEGLGIPAAPLVLWRCDREELEARHDDGPAPRPGRGRIKARARGARRRG